MVMKVNTMSKNIVHLMLSLGKNDGIVQLLVNNLDCPFVEVPQETRDKLIRPKNKESKILPYPFTEDATVTEGSFIRVYYNQGTFDNGEAIVEADLFIDIIVSRNLWLIHSKDGKESLIRPYEIMDRVVDTVGRRSVGNKHPLKIEGYQHLYINTEFDAIRLYCSNWSVETQPSDKR